MNEASSDENFVVDLIKKEPINVRLNASPFEVCFKRQLLHVERCVQASNRAMEAQMKLEDL